MRFDGSNPEYTMQARMPQLPPWLTAKSRRMRVGRGEEFLLSEQELQYVYLVLSGGVVIFNRCANGRENRVVVVPEGGVVGEMEAISGLGRIIYSARAYSETTLVRVLASDFLRWVREDAAACWGLTQVLSEKLWAASMQSSQYGALDAKGRLAQLLLRLGAGRLKLTRQELAGACSVSLRTINRCVKEFREAGLLGIDRGKIEVSHAQIRALRDWMNTDA